MGRCAHEQRWLMGTQIAAQVGGTLSYLVEAVERRIVPVLARTRHDGRFGGALHCDRHPSSSRPARPGLGCVVFWKVRPAPQKTSKNRLANEPHLKISRHLDSRRYMCKMIWLCGLCAAERPDRREEERTYLVGGVSPAAAAAANCRPHDPGRGYRCAVAHGHLSGVGRAHPQVPTPTASGRVAR